MNSSYVSHLLRFGILWFFQTIIIINFPFEKIGINIYPLALLLLPLEVPHAALVAIGFSYGILVDVFYNSLGLHAGVLVVLAYLRPFVCAAIEPRGGYAVGQSLSKASHGIAWFLKYSAIMMGIHTLLAVGLDELALSWVWVLRLLLTYIASMAFVIIYQYIFNPK
jgi:hypothetical protein